MQNQSWSTVRSLWMEKSLTGGWVKSLVSKFENLNSILWAPVEEEENSLQQIVFCLPHAVLPCYGCIYVWWGLFLSLLLSTIVQSTSEVLHLAFSYCELLTQDSSSKTQRHVADDGSPSSPQCKLRFLLCSYIHFHTSLRFLCIFSKFNPKPLLFHFVICLPLPPSLFSPDPCSAGLTPPMTSQRSSYPLISNTYELVLI